ncbi:MAG: tyrosine recombinase XerC [Chloroflexi bacterium]|nr:tyrosine recombinase XerC [Chloroflexota bacterium]
MSSFTGECQAYFYRFLAYLKAERNASPNTLRIYTNDLEGNCLRGEGRGFFQFLELKRTVSLHDVDHRIVREYAAWLMASGMARTSIARRLSAIRSFYRYLAREGIIAVNPVKHTSSPKLDRTVPGFLTVEEVARLIESPAATGDTGLRDRALLELFYASGMRVSELAGLDLEDIDLNTNEIRVTGKGAKTRIVLMGVPAAAALKRYLAEARPALGGRSQTSAVFLSRGRGRLSTRMIQYLIKKYWKSSGKAEKGGKNVHPHTLRHTFATHLLDGGADLKVVQELMGHSSLSSTQVYTHLSKGQLRKVYLNAHPLAKE